MRDASSTCDYCQGLGNVTDQVMVKWELFQRWKEQQDQKFSSRKRDE